MFSDASRCSQMSSMPKATHPDVSWRLDISKSSEHAHRAANRNLSRRVASRCSLGSIWSATRGRAGAVLFLTNLFIIRRAQRDSLFVCSLSAAGLDARRCSHMLLDALRCSQTPPVAPRCHFSTPFSRLNVTACYSAAPRFSAYVFCSSCRSAPRGPELQC